MNVILFGCGEFDSFFVENPKSIKFGEILEDFSGIDYEVENSEEVLEQIGTELEGYEIRVIHEDKSFLVDEVLFQELGMTMYDYCNSIIEGFIQ